jgi:hypothetical protein
LLHSINVVIGIVDIERIYVKDTENMEEAVRSCIVGINGMNESNHLERNY